MHSLWQVKKRIEVATSSYSHIDRYQAIDYHEQQIIDFETIGTGMRVVVDEKVHAIGAEDASIRVIGISSHAGAMVRHIQFNI